MSHQETVREIRSFLCTTFAKVDCWFDSDGSLLQHQPMGGGWTSAQVLEHIMLTSKFLLMTLTKQSKVALKRYERGERTADTESDLERLNTIGHRGSFRWERPEHMEPQNDVALEEVRRKLYEQLGECLLLLEKLKGGAGALARVTMSVNDLGKIDLYQWIYFLGQHAHRHLDQLEKNAADYSNGGRRKSSLTLAPGNAGQEQNRHPATVGV